MSGGQPSAFSVYASRFLAGNAPPLQQQIFRPPSPTPSHDPFLASPSSSHPRLSGSSRTPSPSRTEPFPGDGLGGIPEIDDESEGSGVLFAQVKPPVPNPYAGSSSSSEEIEPDLDLVNALRTQRKGWITHQSVFPPSSSSSASATGLSVHESESDDLDEPLIQAHAMIPTKLQIYHGRVGHWEREGLRKYKAFLALWLSSILGVLIGLCFVWGSTDAPPGSPRSRPSLVPLLPLLSVFVMPALVLPPLFLYLLRRTVRPVLLTTSVAIPFSLFLCGWWALAASFESFDAADPFWGTTGLRICAVLLWFSSACFGRLVWVRRKRLERTVAVVELSTTLLLSHPPLLLLTPLLLGVFAFTSIPFLTLLVRLGTVGYWRHPRENTWVFHIRPYAGWLIVFVSVIWIWSWGVIRGVGRVAVAAVVGEWYFHRSQLADPLVVTTAAVHRATGTSLGSICLGAGIIAIVRAVGKTAAELRRLTSPRSNALPGPLTFLTALAPIFAVVAGILDQLNGYALVYVGITGDAFWPSARRAVGLAGQRHGGHLLDYTLIKLLLTLSAAALGLFTGTAGFLYMSHSIGSPSHAPVAALLCGGIPYLAIRAGASVLGDAADSLFICYQIDAETGGKHSQEARLAFVGEKAHLEEA